MAACFDPWCDPKAAVEGLLEAREVGATLRQAATAAVVHVATVCRGALCSPPLAAALDDAAKVARQRRWAAKRDGRPRVRWHPYCPECGACVAVRRLDAPWKRSISRKHRFVAELRYLLGVGRVFWPTFWRCVPWPTCPWASRRPRHPHDCPLCGEPRYWSQSRKTVHCPRCGIREHTAPAETG